MNRVVIYDTTLRDGMQGTGHQLHPGGQAGRSPSSMDAFGIDYIEGGFPLSNKKEAEFFQRIRGGEADAAPGSRPSAPPGSPHGRRPATRTSGRCSTPRHPR